MKNKEKLTIIKPNKNRQIENLHREIPKQGTAPLQNKDNRPIAFAQKKLKEAIDNHQVKNIQTKGFKTPSSPIQLAAVSLFPNDYYDQFLPKYKIWRTTFWSTRKIVYDKYSLSQIMGKINEIDPTHIGADGIHKYKNDKFLLELQKLKDLRNTALAYNDEDAESLTALSDFQDFVIHLDRFLDKWEDDYGEDEKTEKDRLAEISIKIYTNGDLGIEYFVRYEYSSKLEQYKETLKKKILADPRLIATLRGKDSFKLHLRDDDPDEVAAAIDRAVNKIRDNTNLDTRIKPTDDTSWDSWRKNDCVFAAIIYVMNNDTAKYTSVLGERPLSLSGEDGEKDETIRIANKLGVGHGIVEDPVLFNLMGRLGWQYIAGKTWNNWVRTRQYDGASTYVISYSTSQKGDANHTVVFKNGDVYDRQGKRLFNRGDGEPGFKDQPMEIWKVDTVAAARILT